MNETLYTRTKKRGLDFAHVCEVGVYLPHTSNVLQYAQEGIRTTLVEADPDIVKVLREYFAANTNVKIWDCAVYNEHRELEFCRAESSTFAAELPSSPALANDGYQKQPANTFRVQALRFDEIDDGSIDLLSIDTEGCEWYVLEFLQSRPKVISVETGIKRYVNPHLPQIKDWMQSQGYSLWYRDKSDSVYIQSKLLVLTPWQKLKRALGVYS